MTTAQKRRAKFVFIPAHLSDPLEEWQVEYDDDTAVECLLDRVKVCVLKEEKERNQILQFFDWWREKKQS